MKKIPASLAVLAVLALLVPGCHAHHVVQLSSTPSPKDIPCIACTRQSVCLPTANACLRDIDCARLIACVLQTGELCGPATEQGMSKAQDLLQCWAESCPVCPQPRGGST